MESFKINSVTVDGVEVVNTTPHPITFGVGEETISVPTSVLINAKATETLARTDAGVDYVKTVFEGTSEGEEVIEKILQECPGAVIVGSIIAAQAYPGKVFGMTPLPGYERVAPAEKRMNPHKFTTFE